MINRKNRGLALVLALQLFLGLHVVAKADQPERQPGSPSSGFGIWDQMDGRRLVGDKFLYEFKRTEDCLAIGFAGPDGVHWDRWVLCHAPDGSLRVVEHPRSNPPRFATLDDSGVLTICYAYSSYGGDLISRFTVDGDNITLETGWLEKVRKFSREKRFYQNNSETLKPVTSELVEQASANLDAFVARNNEERERKEQREAEEKAAGQQAAYNYLNGALADATAQAQKSQTDLDATLARISSTANAGQPTQQAPGATSSMQPQAQPAPAPASPVHQSTTQAPVGASARVNANTRADVTAGARDAESHSRESRTETSSASTRDIASNCISEPVVSPHKCYDKTGIKAMVTNVCSYPLDVRVCFMTDKGWNCQANYGVAPGRSWTPGWCAAIDNQVFHSERYSDSKEPLANP